MRRPARLTSLLVAAAMLPAGWAPVYGQGFPQIESMTGGAAKPPAFGQAAPAYPPPRPAAPPRAVTQAQAIPPGEPVAEEDLRPTADDPPIVVGRVARSTGNASYRLPGAEEWQPAGLNTTLTAGTGVWTESGGRLALEVGQSRLFLEGDTAVQLDELDEDGMRATIAQGSGFLRLLGIGTDDGVVEVATPDATLATVVDGRYLIEAAAPDGSRPGRFVVYEGAAEITPVNGEPLRLAAGEALVLMPGAAPERVAAGGPTPLMAWALQAEPRKPVPVAVRGMTGVADLGHYGDWGTHSEYGDVWYPPVQQGWQPYRDGSWQWREPWGWTWVDAAPWGYAPAHYGRWVQIGPRWAWAPRPVRVIGYDPRPAWAPALVAFFGGVIVGQATRPVGWVPLAPREPYYPWYRASPRYVQRINYRQVTNVTVVRNVWIERGGRDLRWDRRDDDRRREAGRMQFYDRRLDEFRNHRAAIQVPERVMLTSQPVRNEARRLAVQDARRSELLGGLPVRPAPETRGVTARSGERLGFSPAQIRAAEERNRGDMPPPSVRAALEERRRDDARARAESQRDAARDSQRDAAREAQRDAARGAQRDAAREAQRDAARDAQRDAVREAQRDAARREGQPDRADRQALRERLLQQQREGAGQPRGNDDAARAAREAQRQELMRQRDQRPLPGEARRQPGADQRQALPETQQQDLRRQQQDAIRQQQDQSRRQDQDASRQQQQEQFRRQREDQARQQREQSRRQDQDAARQQQEQIRRQRDEQARQNQEQMRRQREEQVRQQQDQLRRQQQDQARQQQDQARRQQQDQMRQQQEQARRQQQDQMRQQQEQARRQQQDQARQQQEQARRQQQDQARQQQEQARRQQQDQMRQQQEQARRQQQDQMRQQQEQARRQQQDQARQQQEQARRQQQDQMRQQQAEQRRQERQQR